MATNGLQPIPQFKAKGDPTNRWAQWIEDFNTDTGRNGALLLYQAGPEVHEIFKTLLIIKKVSDQPTPWISPIICTLKRDDGTCINVDVQAVNQEIECEIHLILMLTLSDFRAELNESKYFSKIDVKQLFGRTLFRNTKKTKCTHSQT